MLGYSNCGVFGDVAGGLLGAGLYDEGAEASKIDILTMGEGVLNDFHKLLDSSKHTGTVDAGGLVDFVDDVSFSHNVGLVYDDEFIDIQLGEGAFCAPSG